MGCKNYRMLVFGPKRQGEVSDTDDGAGLAGRLDQVAPGADQHMDDEVPF
jgi:hypothetical protein